MSVIQRNLIIERGIRISGGANGEIAKQAVQVIKEKRENEKQELQFLNQRFSSYVERVKELEAMNRKLLADIENLKSKWGLDSNKIKEINEPELHRIRETIDEVTRFKAIAEIKAKRAESDASQFRHLMDLAMDSFNANKTKIVNLERLLENVRHDSSYLKDQLNDINAQIAKYIDEQKRLFDQLKQLKDDLDKETIDRVAKQNEVQTLEEQIAFLKAVHEQEVSELSRLQTIVGFDPAQFYRTELERAIRDIRGDFEQLNQEQKRELEEWYKIKTEEVDRDSAKEKEFHRITSTVLTAEESNNLKQVHNDSQREYIDLQRRHGQLSARLRELEESLEQSKSSTQVTLNEKDREINALRERINELMTTYDELMSRKTSLEFEIITYRRLLECEESRTRATPIAAPILIPEPSTELGSETFTKRMQVQRQSKGPIGIKEISPDGKFVLIENTGKKGDQDISRWQIRRKVDNEPEIVYVFPVNTIIGSGKSIKIWSRGQGRNNPPNEFVHDLEWHAGDSMITRLINDNGEERALYTQRTQ